MTNQGPIDSKYFRRGSSAERYLYFGVAAHACAFAPWVAEYMDARPSFGVPANITLASHGALGVLAYLGIAGWLAISVCALIFARRRGWASKPWDVILLAVPAIVVTAGIVALLVETRASGQLMHQGKALFGSSVAGAGQWSLVLLGPPIAAAFALGALQLSLLSVCAAARGIAASTEGIRWRHGLAGAVGLAVFAVCVAVGDPHLRLPRVVLVSLLAVVMVWLSGRSRSSMLPTLRAALLGSSAVALGASVIPLWAVPQSDVSLFAPSQVSSTASYLLKIAHATHALCWLCVPPLFLLLLLWVVHSRSSASSVQEQSTSSAAAGPARRLLVSGGLLVLSAGIGPVAVTAEGFALHRAVHSALAAVAPDVPEDVRLPIVDDTSSSSARPSPTFAVGRKRAGFVAGRQLDATRFDGAHCPSLARPNPLLARVMMPLLELDTATAAPRLCCVLSALSGAGFRGVQIAVRSSKRFKLPSPFDEYQPPLRAILAGLRTAATAATGKSYPQLILGHDNLLFMRSRSCARYALSPAGLASLRKDAGELFPPPGDGRVVDVTMTKRVRAGQLVQALSAVAPWYVVSLDTRSITPAKMSKLASANSCHSP